MKILSVLFLIFITALLFHPTFQTFVESSGGSGDGEIPPDIDADDEIDEPSDFNRWLIEAGKETTRKLSGTNENQAHEIKNEPITSDLKNAEMRSGEPQVSVAHTNYRAHHHHHQTHEKQNSFAFRFQEIEVEMNHPKPEPKDDRKSKILYYIYKIIQQGKELTAGQHKQTEANPGPDPAFANRNEDENNLHSTSTSTMQNNLMDISTKANSEAIPHDSPMVILLNNNTTQDGSAEFTTTTAQSVEHFS